MSLIHHAVCQQTCTESILNLFNEKQLSSKLEARKCLKVVWSDFGLRNKFWLSVWREDFFFWHKTKMTNFPCRGRKKKSTQCVPTHGWSMHGASVVTNRSTLRFMDFTVWRSMYGCVFILLLTAHKWIISSSAGSLLSQSLIHYVSASKGECVRPLLIWTLVYMLKKEPKEGRNWDSRPRASKDFFKKEINIIMGGKKYI